MRGLAMGALSILLAGCEQQTVGNNVPPPADPSLADANIGAEPEQATTDPALTDFMRGQVGKDMSGEWFEVLSGSADLDGDGEDEILAYPMGAGICGTGGCGLYVLRKAGSSYRILDELSVAQLPIYKLPAGDDGWAELGVTVYGGGMPEAVMAVPHSAAGYAANPTVPPAYEVDPGDAPIIIAEPPRP